jgi:hypothetical protein
MDTASGNGAKGYWGRDQKNARVWVSTVSPTTIKSYAEQIDDKHQERHFGNVGHQNASADRRDRRPFVLCFRSMSPRSETSLTARSTTSLASSIAFSNNPWQGKPRIGGTQLYSKVGSRVVRASSFEPADSHFERTRPPDIPNFSTSQESYRWPRSSPRYLRDRLMPLQEGAEEGDGVPLFGDGTRDGTRRHNQVYDWSLTKHRYFFPGERQPPSGGLPVSQFPPIQSFRTGIATNSTWIN